MDSNKDGVISEEEFRTSPMISKLPEPIQKEMFDRIDLNKDKVLQREEFTAAAEQKSYAPFLSPKRAPVAQPVRKPIQNQTPQPTMPQAPIEPTPQPTMPQAPIQQRPQPTSGGRHRMGVPGVHHVLQTGIYCAGCNIGVEHHWRICPICGSRL